MEFENFMCFFDPDDQTNSLMVMVRDRTCYDKEKWNVASLSEEEAEKLYKYLKEHFQ